MKKTVCDGCGNDCEGSHCEVKFDRTLSGYSLFIDLCDACQLQIEAFLKKLAVMSGKDRRRK